MSNNTDTTHTKTYDNLKNTHKKLHPYSKCLMPEFLPLKKKKKTGIDGSVKNL